MGKITVGMKQNVIFPADPERSQASFLGLCTHGRTKQNEQGSNKQYFSFHGSKFKNLLQRQTKFHQQFLLVCSMKEYKKRKLVQAKAAAKKEKSEKNSPFNSEIERGYFRPGL